MELKLIHVLLFGLLLSWTVASDEDDVGNANEYVDEVLENLRNEPEVKKHMDPLSVPELNEDKYKLRNIKVTGLSNLYRHGDCTLTYDDDESLSVVAEVAVKNVIVTMGYSAKAIFFWISGDGVISLDHLAVKLDLSSTDGNTRVHSLKVTTMGDYTVRSITGLAPFNWLLKIIADKLAQNARGNIIDALENGAKDALDNVLKQYKLPI